jgi:hypothetical protein
MLLKHARPQVLLEIARRHGLQIPTNDDHKSTWYGPAVSRRQAWRHRRRCPHVRESRRMKSNRWRWWGRGDSCLVGHAGSRPLEVQWMRFGGRQELTGRRQGRAVNQLCRRNVGILSGQWVGQ